MSVFKRDQRLTKLLFGIYLAVVIWILFFKLGVRFSYMENRGVNLVPFKEFFSGGKLDRSQIVLNIVVFVPMGIYVGALSAATFGKKLFFFFLASLLLETSQVVFKIGLFDITDIIANVFGAVVGLLAYSVARQMFRDRVRLNRFINLIGAIGTVLMVSFLILLKLRLLPFRYQ